MESVRGECTWRERERSVCVLERVRVNIEK